MDRFKRLPSWFQALAGLGIAGLVAVSAGAAQASSPAAPTKPAASAAGTPVAGLPGVFAVRAVEGISEYRLANGLQVLLVADDSKPTTTVNLTVRVGSRHENYGETGMAHLLEHLLFKGSPRHPKVWAEFTQRGLAANGSTWYDRTNYTATFAANEDNLNWYVGWLADAMVNSFIARRDLDSEMTVVRNEMEMGQNNPEGVLFELLSSVMYQWHNYGKTTIGARSDVENVDIPRLRAFYRLHYQPDNATLIVSGRFARQALLQQVHASFGRIPRPQRSLPALYTLDAVQEGERSVTLRRAGGVPSVYAGYPIMPAAHADFAAAELLGRVLGDTPSGRLHRRLTERGLAASTFSWVAGLADPGFAVFGAQLPPAGDPDAVVPLLMETVESVAREPVTAEELERARRNWLNAWDKAFADPEVVGISLSESIAQGDWRLFFLQRDRIRSASLADVQRVATQWLLPSGRNLAVLRPTVQPVRAPAPARVDLQAELATLRPQAAAAAVEAFDASPRALDQRTQRFRAGGVEAAVIPKGSRGSTVRAVLTLRFGDERSLAGQGDVPALTAALLDKGSRTLDRQQIQDRLAALRSEVAFAGSAGAVTVQIDSRREHLAEVIALVGSLLREPAFPAEALEELKRQALASIEQQRKEPEALLGEAIARHGNPYPRGDVRHARSFDEREADLRAVSVEQLRAFHARFYGVGRASFGAAGDLDPAALRAALEQAFAGWDPGAPYSRVPDPLVAPPAERFVITTPDKQNAALALRLPVALNDRSPEHAALRMADYLLGGGGHSRLWKRIRETDGLSYDVRTGIGWSAFEENSVFTASAIFAPQNASKVEAALDEELTRALRSGFTAQELAEGKRGLLAFRRLARSQDERLAGALASNVYLGRSFAEAERIDRELAALTLEQVNAALRRHLRPAAFVRGIAGDFKAR